MKYFAMSCVAFGFILSFLGFVTGLLTFTIGGLSFTTSGLVMAITYRRHNEME